MITVGYWCDECRQKYVRNVCKGKLPCGHDFGRSVYVWCQAFGRGGEHVELAWGDPLPSSTADVWLSSARRENVMYGSSDAHLLWGTRVAPFRGGGFDLLVGEWLATLPDIAVRAFFSRWDSQKWMPAWMAFREHPDAKRACALVKWDGQRGQHGPGGRTCN